MSRARRGLFVAFEGGEGCGKTTQSRLLAQWLAVQGRDPVLTRQPGGTEFGAQLREILLHGSVMDPRTEALLFAADRSFHVASMIEPALASGRDVLTDRYEDSSVAYQSNGRGLARDQVRFLSRWGTDSLVPDLTIVLDVDPGIAFARKHADTLDRLERAGDDFHHRVRDCFLDLAATDPSRYLVIDGTEPVDVVHARIVQRMGRLLPDRATA